MSPPSPEPLSASASAASSPEPRPAQTQPAPPPSSAPKGEGGSGSGSGGPSMSVQFTLESTADAGANGAGKRSKLTVATVSSHQNQPQTLATAAPDSLSPSSAKTSTRKHQRKSVAFFLLLDTGVSLDTANSSTTPASPLPSPMLPTIISPSSPAFPVFRKSTPARAQLPSSTLDTALTLRITRAHFRRLAHLHSRTTRLRRQSDLIEYRVLMQQQKDRVHVLRVRAKVEYKGLVAELNRKVHFTRVIERCRRRSTHSALSSIQTSLHRAVSLRRALSENFVSFLDDTAAISNFASSKARTRPGGMTGAGSLDELGTWNEEVDEEYGDDVSDDYYGGEDDGSPPGIPDSPLSSMSSPRGETFSDILHALKFNSDAYFSRNDADGPLSSTLNGGSESDDADSTTAYDRDLLAEFEQTYSARRAMAEGTNARIDALFDMIQALSEGTDRGPALSPASDIEPLFPSPVKRSLVTNTRLSELMSLEEAIIGLTGGIGVSGGGGRKKPLSPVTKLLRRRDLLEEPLSEIVQRNKSLPVEILEELEEADYMELVPLLPTITRFSLRELDMDEILLNAQLRHDLYFDPKLQFKPNTDGERGAVKKAKAAQYWEELAHEIAANDTYRVPLLIYEIKAILKELLPYSQATHQDIDANIDVGLIAQQLEHGIFDALYLIRYLADLMKTNCAPARDERVDAMLKLCEQEQLCESLGVCFEVLELMKLDYANHQLQRIRPHVVENAIKFESNWFKDEIRWKRTTTKNTELWFKDAYKDMVAYASNSTTVPNLSSATNATHLKPLYQFAKPTLTHVYTHALLNLVHNSSTLGDDATELKGLPEILGMDVPRLNTFRSDLQDIVILSCLLMLYRQIAGPKSATNIKTMKENLWVLLNDSETSLAHVVAEMVRGAGTVRGVPVSVAEAKVMDGVVDKTLAPDSKVFGMVTGRVMDLLFGWMVTVLDGTENAVAAVDSSMSVVSDSDSDSDPSEGEEATAQPKTVLPIRKNSSSLQSVVTSAHPHQHTIRAMVIDKAKLAKYGLVELEGEVQDLAHRLGEFARYNRTVYFDLLSSFYEEVRGIKKN